jgi:hypothetical protein
MRVKLGLISYYVDAVRERARTVIPFFFHHRDHREHGEKRR